MTGGKLMFIALCGLILSVSQTNALGGSKTGGFKDSDSNEEHVRNAALQTVKEFNNQNNDVYASKLVKIVRAQHQVVAGIRYELELSVQRTTCAHEEVKDDVSTLQTCQLDESASPHSVRATVVWQSWSNPSYQVEIHETE